MLILGNCIEKLKGINNEHVDLIYMDPPFFTQKNHALTSKEKKQYEFSDKWNNRAEYIDFMKKVLIESKRVLKPTGSIFLHCDKTASHYLRILLDDVFGDNQFQSEIIWSFKRWSNSKKGLLNNHQNIYFYSKSNKFKFNTIYTEYSKTTNIDQILQERQRCSNGKSTYKKDNSGNIVSCFNKKGVPLSDIWEIPFLNPKAKERVGYPTQKPVLLLKQIINIATDVNDIVLDPFCGSGTTLVAAKDLNRNYIGIDKSQEAITLSKNRLDKMIITNSNLLKKGIDDYNNKSEYEMNILNSLNAIPVQRNNGIDGFIKNDIEKNSLIAIKIQKEYETFEESKAALLKAAKSKNIKYKVLVKTNNLNLHSLFNSNKVDSTDLFVIDSLDFMLSKWLKPIEQSKQLV